MREPLCDPAGGDEVTFGLAKVPEAEGPPAEEKGEPAERPGAPPKVRSEEAPQLCFKVLATYIL